MGIEIVESWDCVCLALGLPAFCFDYAELWGRGDDNFLIWSELRQNYVCFSGSSAGIENISAGLICMICITPGLRRDSGVVSSPDPETWAWEELRHDIDLHIDLLILPRVWEISCFKDGELRHDRIFPPPSQNHFSTPSWHWQPPLKSLHNSIQCNVLHWHVIDW